MKSVGEVLIGSIRDKIPKEENIANVLMDIIPLGKEAIYRRLRGEVPFTLDEAVTICRNLNISIDFLMGISQANTYAFHLDALPFVNDPMLKYKGMLQNIIDTIIPFKGSPDLRHYIAYNSMPKCFLYKYKNLSKVYMYILNYQLQSHLKTHIKHFSETHFPEEIYQLQRESIDTVHLFESSIVLNKRMFVDYIGIVKYFELMGLVGQSDIELLRNELYLMIDDMEKCANEGLSFNGKKMSIYLSNITFDCDYICMENKDVYFASSMGVYCLSFITSLNRKIYEGQKEWINSLVKFSSLISVSDELKRKEFFKQQRGYVETGL